MILLFVDFRANCWKAFSSKYRNPGRVGLFPLPIFFFSVIRNVTDLPFYCQFNTQTYIWKLKTLWPRILLKMVTDRGQCSVPCLCNCFTSRQEWVTKAISRTIIRTLIGTRTQQRYFCHYKNVTYEHYFRHNNESSGLLSPHLCIFLSCFPELH
jgi:hypothetical protein